MQLRTIALVSAADHGFFLYKSFMEERKEATIPRTVYMYHVTSATFLQADTFRTTRPSTRSPARPMCCSSLPSAPSGG